MYLVSVCWKCCVQSNDRCCKQTNIAYVQWVFTSHNHPSLYTSWLLSLLHSTRHTLEVSDSHEHVYQRYIYSGIKISCQFIIFVKWNLLIYIFSSMEFCWSCFTLVGGNNNKKYNLHVWAFQAKKNLNFAEIRISPTMQIGELFLLGERKQNRNTFQESANNLGGTIDLTIYNITKSGINDKD